jgi:hypothetical protein
MTRRTDFEAMLEALINEDHDTAKELFHNIVVANSRKIYEELLAEDFEKAEDEEEDETDSEEEDDFGSEEDETDSEEEDDFGSEEDETDSEEGEEFGPEDEDADLTDRVLDLEDALEELKAEFEDLMANSDDSMGDDEMGDDLGGDEFGSEEEDEFGSEEEDEFGSEDEFGGDEFGSEEEDEFGSKKGMADSSNMYEYTNKVALPKHGDNGVNTKSTLGSKGSPVNKMGGTTANIVRGGTAKGEGTKGGLQAPAPKEDNLGNINKPGANVGKTAFKTRAPGNGPEKRGPAEKADNKTSIIGSRGRIK